MEIYIEYAILNNFIIDFIILFSVNLIIKSNANIFRILLGSFIGTCYAIIIPLFNISSILLQLSKIFICGVMVIASFGKTKFFLAYIMTILLTFAFGGGIIFLEYLFKKSLFGENYQLISIGVTEITLGIFLALLFFMRCNGVFTKNTDTKEFFKKVEIEHNGKKIKIVGYIDSGNLLYDKVTNKPIAVASLSSMLPILDNINLEKLDTLYVKSVGDAGGQLRLVTVDKLIVYSKNGKNIHKNQLIGLSYNIGGNAGEYQIILHPQIR